MSEILIAKGSVANISSLGNWDNEYAAGDKGRLNVYLRTAAQSFLLEELQDQLNARGVVSSVAQEGRTVYINFTRGGVSGIGSIGLWPALAAIAIVLALVLAILIISWQLFKTVAGALGPVLPILLLGAGVYLLVRVLKKRKGAT